MQVQQLVEVVVVLEEVLEVVVHVVEKQPQIQAVKRQLHRKVEGSQQLLQRSLINLAVQEGR